MNLVEASKLVKAEHVIAAYEVLRKLDNPYAYLYEQTGRRKPESRYVVVDDMGLPSKAFGFFVAQIAGKIESKSNDLNTNDAIRPIVKLGYVEVSNNRSDVANVAREKTYVLALARPEQASFRSRLLEGYQQTCAVTGCRATNALEAAHVEPFRGNGRNDLSNGILLRADLHRLFDAGDMAFDPATLTTHFRPSISDDYDTLDGKSIAIPIGGPAADVFQIRWTAFCKQ